MVGHGLNSFPAVGQCLRIEFALFEGVGGAGDGGKILIRIIGYQEQVYPGRKCCHCRVADALAENGPHVEIVGDQQAVVPPILTQKVLYHFS